MNVWPNAQQEHTCIVATLSDIVLDVLQNLIWSSILTLIGVNVQMVIKQIVMESVPELFCHLALLLILIIPLDRLGLL